MRITFKNIIGKTLLVGLTSVSESGETLAKTQLYGTIIKSDKKKGISIKIESEGSEEFKAYKNSIYVLPPDLRALSVAGEGVYSLKSTGEEIENPDLLAAYSIHYHNKY